MQHFIKIRLDKHSSNADLVEKTISLVEVEIPRGSRHERIACSAGRVLSCLQQFPRVRKRIAEWRRRSNPGTEAYKC